MKRSPFVWVALVLLPLFLALAWAGSGVAAEAPKNIVAKKCLACHKDYKDMADIVAGDFNSLSNKANSITVKIEDEMQLVKFTAETTVENVPEIKKLKSPIPVRVHYKRVGEDLVATQDRRKTGDQGSPGTVGFHGGDWRNWWPGS